ncbi:MAG: hypothetical protein LBJ24_05660 [Treponema sp.]|jgi:hypothetical protein|nr:hypothetical protein [Treponema sp.]
MDLSPAGKNFLSRIQLCPVSPASPGLKRRRFLALLLGLCLGTAGFCTFSRYRERTGQEAAKLLREEEERNHITEQKRLAEQQLDELKRNYAALMENKKTSVYRGLELIAQCLDKKTLILSAVLKEGLRHGIKQQMGGHDECRIYPDGKHTQPDGFRRTGETPR